MARMSSLSLLSRAADLVGQGESFVLVTIIDTQGSAPRHTGTRMIVRADGSIEGTIGGGRLEDETRSLALASLRSGKICRQSFRLGADLGMCCGGGVELLIEPIGADPRLIIFGAGHVALSLCRLAAEVGFRVVVVDARAELALPERFSSAVEVRAEEPTDAVESLDLQPEDYAVIATHEHRLDEAILTKIVETELKYLGLIGSHSKIGRFRARLRSAGVADETFARVHAPMGLDIGAETPAEIAVSVVAEMIRLRRSDESAGAVSSLAEQPRGSRCS